MLLQLLRWTLCALLTFLAVDQVQALKNMFADEPTVSMDSGITLM